MESHLPPIDPRMEAQRNEFAALKKLHKAFVNLPPIVDDSYPELRRVYEQELTNFLHALIANQRI
jgi:hypothetical protein